MVLTPDSPLFNHTRTKEEAEVIIGPITDSHAKGYENRSLLLEVGKGTTITVTLPNLLLKETDNTIAFRLRGKNLNVCDGGLGYLSGH